MTRAERLARRRAILALPADGKTPEQIVAQLQFPVQQVRNVCRHPKAPEWVERIRKGGVDALKNELLPAGQKVISLIHKTPRGGKIPRAGAIATAWKTG